MLGTGLEDKSTKINIYFFDTNIFSKQLSILDRDAVAAAGRVYVMTH